MKNKFPIEIFYSEEDEGYIAVAPDLSGCTAFGGNEEQALAEIIIAISLWKRLQQEKEGQYQNHPGRFSSKNVLPVKKSPFKIVIRFQNIHKIHANKNHWPFQTLSYLHPLTETRAKKRVTWRKSYPVQLHQAQDSW